MCTGIRGRPGDERMPLRDVGLPYNRTKLLGDQLVLRAIRGARGEGDDRAPGKYLWPRREGICHGHCGRFCAKG